MDKREDLLAQITKIKEVANALGLQVLEMSGSALTAEEAFTMTLSLLQDSADEISALLVAIEQFDNDTSNQEEKVTNE